MSNGHAGDIRAGSEVRADLVTVQLLLDLKNSDPTALTALEAIRTLLGFGDRLAEIRRRSLHELVLRAPREGGGAGTLADLLSAYLERTAVFWNPNKQLAWVRIHDGSATETVWQVQPGARRKPGSFGRPGLSEPEYDHLLVWPRGRREVPADLAPALAGWGLGPAGQGELWSLRWQAGASAHERGTWTGAVGAARSRHEGLLFNPHAQDHRYFPGPVPAPLWSGGTSMAGTAV